MQLFIPGYTSKQFALGAQKTCKMSINQPVIDPVDAMGYIQTICPLGSETLQMSINQPVVDPIDAMTYAQIYKYVKA